MVTQEEKDIFAHRKDGRHNNLCNKSVTQEGTARSSHSLENDVIHKGLPAYQSQQWLL